MDLFHWKMIQFLREIKDPPKVVIFENVAAITNVNMRRTLNLFKKDLEDLEKLFVDYTLTLDRADRYRKRLINDVIRDLSDEDYAKLKDEIREKYGESDMRNVLHSSDSYKNFTHESQVYFYNVNQDDLL